MSPPGPKPASVLILGSGPVVIGQAAEFDYAGTQACRALRAEGVRTILINSNPATIMTDPSVADVIYLEPLTVEAVEAVIAAREAGGVAGRARWPDRPEPRDGAVRGRRLRAPRHQVARHAARGHPDGRGPRGVPRSRSTASTQPYAPSVIVEGATDAERDASADGALAEIGCRRSSGRPSRWVGRAAASSRPSRPTANGSGPACAPVRSARSWSSAASSAGRRSNTRSCAMPTTRASPCARWRTSIRWACIPAIRSSSHRSRR